MTSVYGLCVTGARRRPVRIIVKKALSLLRKKKGHLSGERRPQMRRARLMDGALDGWLSEHGVVVVKGVDVEIEYTFKDDNLLDAGICP